MKACDVVTGLRAEVEQWRARAIRAEGRGTGHEEIACQRAEIERLRSDLARVVAERDKAREALIDAQEALQAVDVALSDLPAPTGDRADAIRTYKRYMVDDRAKVALALDAALSTLATLRPEYEIARGALRQLQDQRATERAYVTRLEQANAALRAERVEAERDEARANLAAVRASLAHECQRRDERVVSAETWAAMSALADAVKAEVPDAD